MNHLADYQLMQRIAHGDEQALRQLINQCGRKVWHTAWMLLGDSMAADDVQQEVFIRVWSRANRYDGSSSALAWMSRIAINLSLDELRRRSRRQRWLLQRPAEPIAPSVEDSIDDDYLHQLLSHAIAQLPEKQRAVYVLREVEDLSNTEVAAALDLSPEQTKANLYHARKQIINFLKQYGIQ